MLGLFNNHSKINNRKKTHKPPFVNLHIFFFAATSFYAFFVNRKKARNSFVRQSTPGPTSGQKTATDAVSRELLTLIILRGGGGDRVKGAS